MVSDEDLMRAVSEGDLSKLGILFERYHLALFEFLSRMTGSRHISEDLVQEVFLRLLKYRRTYREGAPFRTWIYRIARNARADYFAKQGTAVSLTAEAFEPLDESPGPEGQTERELEAALLGKALLLIREDRRELIILARYQEMKHEAIADLLGLQSGAVKVRIHRALNDLRDAYLRLLEISSCDAKKPPHTPLIT